jgi:hypothetical protein
LRCFQVSFVILFGWSAVAKADSTVIKNKAHSYNGFHIEACYTPIVGEMTEQFKEPTSVNGKSIELNVGFGVNERLRFGLATLRSNLNKPHETITNSQGAIFEIKSAYKIREEIYGIGLAYHAITSDIILSADIGSGRFVFSSMLPIMDDHKTKFGYFGQLKIGKHWWLSDELGFSLSLLGGFLSVEEKYNSTYYVLMSSYRVSLQAAFGLR